MQWMRLTLPKSENIICKRGTIFLTYKNNGDELSDSCFRLKVSGNAYGTASTKPDGRETNALESIPEEMITNYYYVWSKQFLHIYCARLIHECSICTPYTPGENKHAINNVIIHLDSLKSCIL